jgi:hypothetical protein
MWCGGAQMLGVDSLRDAEVVSLRRKVVALERCRTEAAAKAQSDMRAMQLALTQITRVAQATARSATERIQVSCWSSLCMQ